MVNIRSLICAISVFLLVVLPAYGQVEKIDFREDQQMAREKRQTEQILEQNNALQSRIEERRKLEKSLFELDATEGWISPDEYRMGSGDILAINFIGNVNEYVEVIVSPEGYIDVPGVFTIRVKDKSLAEVKLLVESTVNSLFKGTKAHTHLVGFRPMKVYILGEVVEPGAYIAKPIDRLFNVIHKSGGSKRLAMLSDVLLIRGADTLKVNGYDYYLKGELESNPVLSDGDIIYIRRADPQENTVMVQGGVIQPGLYPVEEGESLGDFLHKTIDFDEDVDFSMITVRRPGSSGNGDDIVYQSGKSHVRMAEVNIMPNDVIEIGLMNEVYIQGAVHNPGAYPFVSGFKAIDYVGLAGGVNEKGNVQGLYILHKNGEKNRKMDMPIKRGDIIVVPRSIWNMFFGDLSAMEIVSASLSVLLTIEILGSR